MIDQELLRELAAIFNTRMMVCKFAGAIGCHFDGDEKLCRGMEGLPDGFYKLEPHPDYMLGELVNVPSATILGALCAAGLISPTIRH